MSLEQPLASSKTILVVDDMPVNLSLLAEMLSGRGYDVRVTRSPQFALRSMQFTLPDLILLDICMPEMDGYQVCQMLKADERTRDIPVIFISALDSTLDKVKAFKIGGVDYITKPFEAVEVLARVETHLRLQERSALLQLEIQERQQAEMESSVMLMATQAIARARDVAGAIAALVCLLCQMLECERAEAWRPNADGTSLERVPEVYFVGGSCQIAAVPNAPHGETNLEVLEQIWTSGEPQWVEDLSLHPRAASATQMKAVFGVPILNQERVYAILMFYHRQVTPYKPHVVELVSTIAGQISFLVDRKQAEAAQRRAEQKYQSIFENSLEGIFQSTYEGRFLSANPALARIYGYDSPTQLIDAIADIARQLYVHPQHRQQFLSAAETPNGVSDFEVLAYRRDGATIWVAETGRAVRDETGNILYYEGTVTDITDRKRMQEALREQKAQTEGLLLNILPRPIAQRLQMGESPIADYFEDASILFADLVGFTGFAARKTPVELVEILSAIFSEFDGLAEKFGLEKIKTIGDNYMVVGGLPVPRENCVAAIAQMALAMRTFLAQFNLETGQTFQLRIGINVGSVVAGVMGRSKMIYDLWGDAVNIASRMESTSEAGKIQVTAAVYERLKHQFSFEKRGDVEVRGKGTMLTYWLLDGH
ncbi:MAG: adenylate/guanylate cyclase domain-containing protein [Cyanobacteriota bacterium]|nr:adenylate/guanylate cyclase domain-containing protein [Cyanobacteriota bacterium]